MITRHATQVSTGTRFREGAAAPLVPPRPTLQNLRQAASHCQACPLWKKGTQTVFGQGSSTAQVMLIGEQPGFEEDLAGEPFVGPAGKLLDRALVEAGIDRNDVYVTNVVKHFKWEAKGQQHIHKKPNAKEVSACLPWLEAELQVVRPRILVCLGATAAQALLGRDFRVSRQRGEWLDSDLATQVLATVHPSSILRAPDADARHQQFAQFVADLTKVAKAIRALK